MARGVAAPPPAGAGDQVAGGRAAPALALVTPGAHDVETGVGGLAVAGVAPVALGARVAPAAELGDAAPTLAALTRRAARAAALGLAAPVRAVGAGRARHHVAHRPIYRVRAAPQRKQHHQNCGSDSPLHLAR